MGAYGWRATLGCISPPSVGETFYKEAFTLLPDGVSMCVAALGLKEFEKGEFDRVLARIEEGAKELARRNVDIISWGGNPLVVSRAAGHHDEIVERIKRVIEKPTPVFTDMAAVLAALEKLSIKKLVVATPYPAPTNDALKLYLEAYGFEVLCIKGMGLSLAEVITVPTLHSAYQMARQAFCEAPNADGVFISCPQWPVVNNIAPLERDLKKPVVAQLQARVWMALSTLNIRQPIGGFGRLLEEM